MSVIVATSQYMVGDRRLSIDTGERLQPHTKIFKNKYLIAGGSGYFQSIVSLKQAMRSGCSDPEELIEYVDNGSEYIVLSQHTGYLYTVNDKYVIKCSKKILGTGSGAECALAFMAGKGSTSLDCAKKALRYTFKVRMDCGDGVRTIKRGD